MRCACVCVCVYYLNCYIMEYITLSAVGAMLLCWQVMPGAEFSPGHVSER